MREEIQKLINKLSKEIHNYEHCGCRASCNCSSGNYIRNDIKEKLSYILDIDNFVAHNELPEKYNNIETIGDLQLMINDIDPKEKVYFYTAPFLSYIIGSFHTQQAFSNDGVVGKRHGLILQNRPSNNNE